MNKYKLLLILCLGFAINESWAQQGDIVLSEDALEKAGSLSAELAVERKLKEQEKKFVLERHYSQGLAYYSEQKFDDALRAFNIVLKIDRSYKSCLKYIEKIQSDIKELARRKARESNSRLYDQVLGLTKQGSYDRALEKLELIISNKNPEYKGRAEEYIEVIEQKMSAEKQGQEWSAEDQSRRAKEREITDRLTRGRKYYKKRQFDKAITEWQRILALTDTMSIDYKVAEKLIVKARKKKIRIGEKELAREKEITTQLLLTDSRKKWLAVSAGNAGESEVEASRAGEEVVQSKKQILVLSGQRIAVDFDNKHIRDVITHLKSLTGINIILEDVLFPKTEEGVEVSGAISPYVTIHLKDIPMIEALDLMLRTKDLKYRVEENLIWITTVETLEKENFKTRVFNLSSGAGAIKDIIEEVVSFPEGSSINLDARSDTLIVTHTPTKLEVIRDIVMALDQTPVQVEIQARFLEVQDEFAKEFSSHIAAYNLYAKTKDLDLDYQSPDHIGKEIEPHYSRFNYIEMDPYAVTDETLRLDVWHTRETIGTAIITAMASEGKLKVLSEPSVTTLNNMSAAIRMTESVTYPGSYSVETETEVGPPGTTDYKQSKLKTGDTVSKDTGIILTVKPSVGDDRKTISLSLLPRVIELVSWTTLTLPNDSKIHLPKFEERRVETSLIINDGETVILGGLSKQSENKYKDGIPGLINIPFLGSIFAKKTKSDLTNSLLIFVTARIVSPSGGTYK